MYPGWIVCFPGKGVTSLLLICMAIACLFIMVDHLEYLDHSFSGKHRIN